MYIYIYIYTCKYIHKSIIGCMEGLIVGLTNPGHGPNLAPRLPRAAIGVWGLPLEFQILTFHLGSVVAGFAIHSHAVRTPAAEMDVRTVVFQGFLGCGLMVLLLAKDAQPV